MRGPYGFEQNESCRSCKLRTGRFFCQLSPEALQDFDALKSVTTYPQGAVLMLEKADPRGVMVLCAGRVKLSIGSPSGKTLILRIAQPGEILGLMAALSASPYEVTAETIRPCQVAFLRRDAFVQFVKKHPEVYQVVFQQLNSLYHGACEQLRTVALSASAPEKLARLLLAWSSNGTEADKGAQIRVPLTHEEMAEFIGATRETVSRTLSQFRQRHLVVLQGSTITIPNRAALEAIGCG